MILEYNSESREKVSIIRIGGGYAAGTRVYKYWGARVNDFSSKSEISYILRPQRRQRRRAPRNAANTTLDSQGPRSSSSPVHCSRAAPYSVAGVDVFGVNLIIESLPSFRASTVYISLGLQYPRTLLLADTCGAAATSAVQIARERVPAVAAQEEAQAWVPGEAEEHDGTEDHGEAEGEGEEVLDSLRQCRRLWSYGTSGF